MQPVAHGSESYRAAISILVPQLVASLVTSFVETLPHGLRFKKQEPALLSVKLSRAHRQQNKLKVIHQHRPGEPWHVSDEVVQLSSDGQTATIPILSFCGWAVVDADVAGATLPSTVDTAAFPGAFPAPTATAAGTDAWDKCLLDGLDFSDDDDASVCDDSLPAMVVSDDKEEDAVCRRLQPEPEPDPEPFTRQ